MTANPAKEPVLRFSGFSDPWKQTRLGDVGDLYQPKTISQTDLTTEGYTVYGANGIIGKYHSFNHEKQQVAVTCRGSTCGLVNYTEPHSWITGNAMVVNLDAQPDETKRFVYHALNATDLRYIITGSGQPQITGNLKEHKIGLPTLPEQRKIADFLTAVDGRIGQLSQKKALLEDYKKGVMQQLFTQALRFKDDHGNDFPEWEEKTLGDIGSVAGGGTPDSTNDTYWNGDVQWFTPTEIRSKFVSRSKRTISASGLKNCSASILPRGTLLFTSRATIAEVSIATEPCTTNQGFQSITVNQNANNEFIYYWVIHFKKEFLRKAQGSTFLEIGGKEVRKMPLLLPSFPEQTKIANFLAALDRKIESVSQQISHTQSFKKGLLQQMFV